jgi:hypothetical protein
MSLRMIPTQSSMTAGIALDDEQESIYVRFRDGAVYAYSYQGMEANYCAAAFGRILAAQSQGTMINQVLKKNGEFLTIGPLEPNQIPEFHA